MPCNAFFINYEALKKYISNGNFPSFRYILVRPNDLKLNDVSELGLYGYSVRQGGLNQEQRHKLLAWIIESRLMKKQDIIKALEFKIHYNGKKSGNETACLKWENDLHFVSTYTADNTHSIRAKFR